jgi:uncharacterized cupin superfamily protein
MAETANKPVVNIADVALQERGHGETFKFKMGRVGPMVGLTGLGCTIHVVPPGKRAWPFHRHHVMDELFFIVSGKGEYRFGEETFAVGAGDIIGAPAGSQAHQIINTGKGDIRYLGISSMSDVDIVEYPDSKKVAIAAGVKNADFKTATYVGVGRIAPADYWDGEGTP